MPSITKYRAGYRAQVAIKGTRDSATFRTKREAEAWAARRETEIRTRANLPPDQAHTLGDALKRYARDVSPTKRGRRWEEIRIDAFLRDAHLPIGKGIGELTPDVLGIWRDTRLKTVGAGTVLREFSLLSAVLEEARREWRWITANPCKDVRKPKEPRHREVVITRAQIRKMLVVMDYRPGVPVRTVAQSVAVCFLLALRTGMRAGELCGLTWDRIHPAHAVLKTTKTVPRDVPLTPKAKRLVDKMRGFDPLLVFGLKAASLDAMFRKYRQRAGLEGFVFHDARHTAATWMAKKIHILELCRVFGWSNTSQALVYFNPKASDIASRL